MSEYIVDVGDADELHFAAFQRRAEFCFGYPVREEIVRCLDCKHYYEAETYHPNGNYVRRWCLYFDTYNDEVEPDGFCKWGERK